MFDQVTYQFCYRLVTSLLPAMEFVLTSFQNQCWPVCVHCSCTPHLPCQGTLAGSGRGCSSSWKRLLHLMAPSLRTQPRYAAAHYQVDATCLEGLTCMQRPHACARCEFVVTCWKVKKYISRCSKRSKQVATRLHLAQACGLCILLLVNREQYCTGIWCASLSGHDLHLML